MTITESEFYNFQLTQQLRFVARSATIRAERAKGDSMGKSQAVKTEDKPNPLDFSAEFVEGCFKDAVKATLEENARLGLDSYGAIDGKLIARKPDGRIVPLAPEEKTNG